MLDLVRYREMDPEEHDPALLHDAERLVLSATLTQSLFADLAAGVRSRGVRPSDLRELAVRLTALKNCLEAGTVSLSQLTASLSFWYEKS